MVVVTGASTGIGAATARQLASDGFHVLAGVRTESAANEIRGENLEPVMLDVTEPEHIQALVARVDDDPDKRPLRVLINNAGIEINAPIEVLPLELWRKQFEVNVFGPVALVQALLPHLRLSRGRIINVSSVGGEAALPIYGAYAGSKFALEAVSDAMRRELTGQGIQVVVVQPGGVQTVMSQRSGPLSLELARSMDATHTRLYGELIESAVASQSGFLERALPAPRAGARIARIATVARPRARYTVGLDAALVIPMARMLPARVMDRLLDPLSRSRRRSHSG
jgi:NAD(P)-dependent dehydrogenase (short-subunit alcohol dehydrogenase family)